MASYEYRWHLLGELGEGGQGKVFKTYRISDFDLDELVPALKKSIQGLAHTRQVEDIGLYQLFESVIKNVMKMQDSESYCALKVLHSPKDARNPEKAQERIRNEIRAMQKIKHSNLLPIIEVDPDFQWFVSPYYSKGTLATNASKFVGNPIAALRALRPLVKALVVLHDDGIVHRDVKPQNIFLDSQDNLILGDFGLVFFNDVNKTRLSDSFENVGSRDWMPPWAYGMRVGDVRPSFDVFSVGKVLWSMVSGRPILPLWYYDRQDCNLELIFRSVPYIELINAILRGCVVEQEQNCWNHAELFLQAVDKALFIIDTAGDIIRPNVTRSCKVCSVGTYEMRADSNLTDLRNLGLSPAGATGYKFFVCNHCGHVQLFMTVGGTPYRAWQNG